LENIAFDIEAGGSENQVRLIWKQYGSQYRFTAGHLSDGTIRFLCLVTPLPGWKNGFVPSGRLINAEVGPAKRSAGPATAVFS
jgi:hypothetical protein